MKRRYDRFERQTERVLQARGISSFKAKKDRTTKADLYELWGKLTATEPSLQGHELVIQWDYKYDKKTMWSKPVILNLGNPLHLGGTHWVAVYKDKYFDSYGLAPPSILMDAGWSGDWNKRQIQGVLNGNCGQYAILWLSYVVRNKENEFFNLFK